MTVQLPIRFRNIFFILIGSFIFAFGVYHFNVQNNLAEGGFTGITLILRGLFDWSPSITNLALNIPLFFVSYKLLGRSTFIYTLIGTFSFSLWYALIAKYSNLIIDLTDDMVLASLFAVSSSGSVSASSSITAGRREASISSPGSSNVMLAGQSARRSSCSTFSSSSSV